MTETKKKRYWYRPDGYETDHLIDSLSDEELLAHMGVPVKYTRHAIEMQHDLPKEAEAWLRNIEYIYRPNFERLEKDLCGMGLILSGPGSTRKTTTAAAILLRAVRMKTPNTDPTGHNFTWHGAAMGRFVDWQEASELFRSASRSEEDDMAAEEVRRYMKPNGPAIHRADFLVLDDISRERPTEYNAGELQRTIRRRADNGYPTIITTNHSSEEWPDAHGEVLTGFLMRSAIVIEFSA
jgi:DNA replication protein DnaC